MNKAEQARRRLESASFATSELHALLRAESPPGKPIRECDVVGELKQELASNAKWLQSLDYAMRRMVAHGLDEFLPRSRCCRLRAGERRILKRLDTPGSATSAGRLRSFIDDGSQMRLEAPELRRGGVLCHPLVHLHADFGPVGAPAVWWLLLAQDLRATFIPDLLHMRMRDIERSQKLAGLATKFTPV